MWEREGCLWEGEGRGIMHKKGKGYIRYGKRVV